MNIRNEDWRELLPLFEHLSEAAPDTREHLLDELTRGRPQLRARLLQLLDLDACGQSIAHSVAQWRERLLLDADQTPPPTRLGPWRIVRELGAGGMGQVFLAERADGTYEQKVALKLIRAELNDESAIRRFLDERRMLAVLDHPGIAGLIDGGVDESGRPWFAMHHVEGIPLPEYCTKHQASLDERLRLLIAVCDAVAYAHRHFVVHCDLKPSNVLVDASGQPQLLDFGIARWLERAPLPDPHSATTATHALTPGYASPEQLAGEPLGTTSDVYAIGAMLHEVLGGQRPYAGSDTRVADAVQAQARGEPPAVSLLAQQHPGPVAPRQLRGDLDTIVSTALRHDPAQRYPDAAALGDDLRAFLSGRPLCAQRNSPRHRARKFVARHRLAVALSVLALIGLIATTAFALQQNAVARRELVATRAVRDFLLDIFRGIDPRETNDQIDTRLLIDRSAANLDNALKTQPELAASFAQALGEVYFHLAAYDQAETMLQRALDLTRAREGMQAPASAPVLRILAQTLAERGKLGEADAALASARAIDSQHADIGARVDDDAIAADLAQLAGKLDQAQKLIDAAINSADSLPSSRRATLLNQRAQVAAARGALDDAERDTQAALALFREQDGNDTLDVAENLINLGVLRMRRGDAAGAEPIFREGLATYQRRLPSEHPLLAKAMSNLARALDREGKSDEAEPIYLDVLAMQRRLFGETHADVATTLNNLAVLHVGRSEYAKARTMMQAVVDIWTRLSGARHPLALASRTNLGVIEREEGDYAAARATLESVLADYRSLPDMAAREAGCLDQLGTLDRYEGKPDQALVRHREAAALRAGLKQLNPLERAAGLVAWSLSESAAGAGASAREHAIAALTLLDSVKAQSDPHYADALVARARAELALHDIKAATASVQVAAAVRAKHFPASDWRNAEIELLEAELAAQRAQRTSAITKAAHARDLLIAQRGVNNPLVDQAKRLLTREHAGAP